MAKVEFSVGRSPDGRLLVYGERGLLAFTQPKFLERYEGRDTALLWSFVHELRAVETSSWDTKARGQKKFWAVDQRGWLEEKGK